MAHIDARSLQNENAFDPEPQWKRSVTTDQIRAAAKAELEEICPAGRGKITTVGQLAEFAEGELARRASEVARLSKTLTRDEPHPRVNLHPGELLRKDFMVPLRLTPRALARNAHLPLPTLRAILAGRSGVDPATDRDLCSYFRQKRGYWLRAQVAFDARNKSGLRIEIMKFLDSAATDTVRDPAEKQKASAAWAKRTEKTHLAAASAEDLREIAEKLVTAPTAVAFA